MSDNDKPDPVASAAYDAVACLLGPDAWDQHKDDVEDAIREAYADQQAEIERLRETLAHERSDAMEFVPDARGGHFLSNTGDKWYPEKTSTTKEEKEFLNEEPQ